jgi:hypothetical protein
MVLAAALCGAATTAGAEQRWQCGEGLTVPLQGSRADNEAACKLAREKRDAPPPPIDKQKAAELQDRVEKLEKQYGLDIDVKYQ